MFEHADGSPYGATSASPARAQALAGALELLVALGFRQNQAQAMLDRVRTHVGPAPRVDEVARLALKHAPPPPGAGRVRESAASYRRALPDMMLG